ncbi:uncharacterized protein [Henckelia pumila]|uniref:uncharacterized protein n=1 Tax=Henckelia pumila TaxID=405737 RepID=UPI003C6E9CF4
MEKLLAYSNNFIDFVVSIQDFNDILSQSEKRGRYSHPISLITGFRDTTTDFGLFDLGMKGHRFTWERSRGTPYFVEEKLDRILATSSWSEIFNAAKVLNLDTEKFRFENAWLLEPDCKDIVNYGWLNCINGDIQHRIADCGNYLQLWGEKVRQRIFKKDIRYWRAKLQCFKRRQVGFADDQIGEIKRKLASLLTQEEIFWKKRAKIFWLKAGDANTKFFHNYASMKNIFWLKAGDANTKLFHNYASSRRRKNQFIHLHDNLGNIYS